jgi:hypothetical protein
VVAGRWESQEVLVFDVVPDGWHGMSRGEYPSRYVLSWCFFSPVLWRGRRLVEAEHGKITHAIGARHTRRGLGEAMYSLEATTPDSAAV